MRRRMARCYPIRGTSRRWPRAGRVVLGYEGSVAEQPVLADETTLGLAGDVERGLEAYARGAYFDAHEAFERAWRASGEPRSIELHALAQWAAAVHKHRAADKRTAALAIARRANEKLRRVEASRWGVDVRGLERAIAAWVDGALEEIPSIPKLGSD